MHAQAYGDVAYGWAMEDDTGFCKVLAERGTGRLLGAHILGPDASVVIQPLIQAMSFGLAIDPLRRLVGEIFGPVESGVSSVVDPVVAIPHWLRSKHDLASDIDRLESENEQLRSDSPPPATMTATGSRGTTTSPPRRSRSATRWCRRG